MRIAYIAPYKGPTLVQRRPVVTNLSLSNTIKIELITKLLRSKSHEVDIISFGEVVEPELKFYPAFQETNCFHPEIPIYYASALPVRFVTGFWSSSSTLGLFKKRNRRSRYDVVIIFNTKPQHIACAEHAMRKMGLPVILEYEDDSFVDVSGEAAGGWRAKYHQKASARIISNISGGIGVSPYLLAQLPGEIPKLLLRGVVGDDIVEASQRFNSAKKNRVVFSGTHIKSNGVSELIDAWAIAKIDNWELHITGHGQLTLELKRKAEKIPGVIFHGLVSRAELVDLLVSAKICINPYMVSKTPGNVFAFKVIEYLGAGAHVMTTPMGALEKEVESGITYIPDNTPGTMAAAMKDVILTERWKNTAAQAVRAMYGCEAAAESLDIFLQQVVNRPMKACGQPESQVATSEEALL